MFRLFNISQDNLVATTGQLLWRLKVKVNNSTISQTLQEHPDYPSVLSIIDSLKAWKVDSLGVKTTYDQMISFPCPMLVHFKTGQLYMVTHITDISITFTSDHLKEETIPKEDFLKQWDGVALLAEAGSDSGEVDYHKMHRTEILQQTRIPLALLIAFLLVLLTGISAIHLSGILSIFPLLLSLAMLAGVFISSLLLWYEVDKQNPVLQKICTGHKHTNCSAVLQSKASNLWGIFTWSEIGFAYFTGGFLCLLLGRFNPVIMEIAAWLNLLAVPYIFFSVFYQWRIAKQWCVLCLTVQVLLLSGFVICLAGRYYAALPHDISMPEIALLVVVYLLPLFSWKQIKPLWLNAREGRHYKLQLLRVKHDKRIFEALLPKQKVVLSDDINGLGIQLGNPDASRHLVKVCSPYCGPCARAHPEIEKILEMNPDVSAQIIFTAKDDDKDIKSRPVRHLMAIDEKGNKETTKQALDDWYGAEKKDYDSFANKYPLNGELKDQGEKLKAMNAWCEKTGISFTPTFFVSAPSPEEGGGVRFYQMPEIYGVEDLKYLLV